MYRAASIDISIEAVARRQRTRLPRAGFVLLGAVVVSGAAVQAASSGPIWDVKVTTDTSRRWAESGIAVNPRNPNNIVVASQGLSASPTRTDGQENNVIAAYVSFDRGKTWRRVNFSVVPRGHPTLTAAGDPHITAGPDGTFYFSFDSFNWGTNRELPNAGVSVSKSTDGGLTWSEPILGGTPADGPKITTDLSSGMIYLASSSQIGPRSTGDPKTPVQKDADRWLISSKDAVNWTKPKGMGGVGGSMSAAHGMLANTFKTVGQASVMGSANNHLCGTAPTPCTIFQTTTDSGTSWTRHVLSISNDYSGNPMVAADPTKKSHFALAVPIKGSAGFMVYKTRDAGKSWSTPVMVTEDPGRRHFHSWMAYSPQGVLGMMWRSDKPVPVAAGQGPARGQAPGAGQAPARDGTGAGQAPARDGTGTALAPARGGRGPASQPVPYNVWAVISRDGGTSFSAPLNVSSADPPAPRSASAGDDYSGLAVGRDHVHVVWADWRSVERDNYVATVPLSAFSKPAR